MAYIEASDKNAMRMVIFVLLLPFFTDKLFSSVLNLSRHDYVLFKYNRKKEKIKES